MDGYILTTTTTKAPAVLIIPHIWSSTATKNQDFRCQKQGSGKGTRVLKTHFTCLAVQYRIAGHKKSKYIGLSIFREHGPGQKLLKPAAIQFVAQDISKYLLRSAKKNQTCSMSHLSISFSTLLSKL